MFVQYNNLDIRVRVDQISMRILNLAKEKLCRIIPSHSHGSGSYELHYTSDGYGKVLVEGQLYALEPGSMYVVGPGVKHAQIPDFNNQQVDCCVYLQVLPFPSHINSTLWKQFFSTSFWIGKDREDMLSLFHTIFGEMIQQRPGYTVTVESLLTQLLVALLRNYDMHDTTIAHYAAVDPAEARTFICEEAFLYEYSDLTLQALAGKLGIGARQTQRFLIEYYGKTFREMRSEARMSAAGILLTYTTRDIYSIAEELGYSTSEHFTVSFKNHFGLSPSEYRAKHSQVRRDASPLILNPPDGLKSARVSRKS